MASPADNRISIRNEQTGEISHGIKGHLPRGWVEYKPDEKAATEQGNHQVEAGRVVPGAKPGRAKAVVQQSLSAVRGKKG